MIFTLEALNARHGDALLLHYGTAAAPKLIVIDGGPTGIFESTLSPRLEELRVARKPNGALPIRLMMVSHIDDDHVTGVLALARSMQQAEEDGEAATYAVTELWHNSFDDLVKKVEAASTAQIASKLGEPARAVIASVPQGRELRGLADQLGIGVNKGFDGLVVCPAKGKKAVKISTDLALTVLGPRQAQLDKLQNEWAKQIKTLKSKGKLAPLAMSASAAEFVDTSVTNLSSIVVLAEVGSKRMLLTGDARGDFVLDSLTEAGLLKKQPLKLDVFKLPHHGSIRNSAAEMFAAIQAKHYVISADGRFGNPDPETLDLLVASRAPADDYTIYLTNPVPKIVKQLTKAQQGKKFKVVARAGDDLSVRVELGTKLAD